MDKVFQHSQHSQLQLTQMEPPQHCQYSAVPYNTVTPPSCSGTGNQHSWYFTLQWSPDRTLSSGPAKILVMQTLTPHSSAWPAESSENLPPHHVLQAGILQTPQVKSAPAVPHRVPVAEEPPWLHSCAMFPALGSSVQCATRPVCQPPEVTLLSANHHHLTH